VGEIRRGGGERVNNRSAPDLNGIIEAVTKVCRLTAEEICSRSKQRSIVMAKEAMIIVGQEQGASNAALAEAMGVHNSAVSRRFDSGKTRLKESREMQKFVKQIREAGRQGGAGRLIGGESQNRRPGTELVTLTFIVRLLFIVLPPSCDLN